MATSFCIAMFVGLGLGCTQPAQDSGSDSYCKVAETIYASKKDTAETLRQVRRENAKRRKCKKVSVNVTGKGTAPIAVTRVLDT